MTSMNQPLFDPFAPIEAQTQDSFEKGFISRDDADILNLTSRWVDENEDRLLNEFPGKIITVAQDDSLPGGFATYVGDSVLEAEANCRQFSPGIPYVTINPFAGFCDFPVFPISPEGFLWSPVGLFESFAAENPEVGKLLQESETKEEGSTEEPMEKLEKLALKLSDDQFAEILGPRIANDHPITWGFIKDKAGHANLKRWLIDSGASTSAISKKNFERLVKKGAKPKHEGEEERKTAGKEKAKFPKYSGIIMRFVRKEGDKNKIVDCDVPLLVSASDILGLDQMKKTGTTLFLDPAGGVVEFKKRSATKKAEKKDEGKDEKKDEEKGEKKTEKKDEK